MIDLARRGEIGTILVDRQDRFGTSNSHEWGWFCWELTQAGCRIVETSSGRDLTARDTGSLVVGVINAEASAREQVDKGVRSLGGKVHKTRDEGRRCGGTATFGFDRACLDSRGLPLWFFYHNGRSCGVQVFPCDSCRTTPRGLAGNRPCPNCRRVPVTVAERTMPRADGSAGQTIVLIPSEDQSRIDVVRQVFEWFITRAEYTTGVAALCRKAGYTLYGRPFTAEAVKKIVSNPAYVGDLAFGRKAGARFAAFDGERVVEMPPDANRKPGRRGRPVFSPGRWPGLVDRETWDKAQRKLARHGDEPRPPRTADAWLKGLLYCGKCRKPMKPSRVRGRVHYCCPTRRYQAVYGNPSGCGYHYVRADAAERLIADKLASLKGALTDPDARSRVLALYAARGQKLDDVARLVKDGALAFADLLEKRFQGDGGGGRLGEMVREFRSHFGDHAPGHEREWALDFLLWDTISLTPTDDPGVDEMRTDPAALSRLMAAIEEEAAACAARRLAEVRAELDDVYEGKFKATSGREREWLDRRRVGLENEADTLEQHAVPLSERHARLVAEADDLAARIRAADDPLADSEPMRKHEAVRGVLGKIYLHFEKERRGGRERSVLVPERTQFSYVVPTAPSSPRGAGRRTRRGR
jgi:hypothetical protein